MVDGPPAVNLVWEQRLSRSFVSWLTQALFFRVVTEKRMICSQNGSTAGGHSPVSAVPLVAMSYMVSLSAYAVPPAVRSGIAGGGTGDSLIPNPQRGSGFRGRACLAMCD